MSAPWLAKGFAGDLAISAEVHAADHEAVRVVSGLVSWQLPMNHPENFRAISGQRLGNST